MSRTGWLPVTAIAVLSTVVIAVLASIGQGQGLSAEAYLREALAQAADHRYVQSRSSGTETMLNGDVYRRHTESARDIYTGDMRWRQWYEDCSYPHVMDTRLCSIEIVVHDNVRYERLGTSDGPGEWELVGEEWDALEGAFENSEPGELLSSVIATWDTVELESETIDGVTHRLFRVTRRPGEDILKLIDSGEWELPKGFPPNFSREDYVRSLREIATTEQVTHVYWVSKDSGEIRRVEWQWEKTYADDTDLPVGLLPQHSYEVIDYSRHNEPVEILPPVE